MPYKLTIVPRPSSSTPLPTSTFFPALINCMWQTYENPLQPLYYIWAPPNAAGTNNKDEAIAESTARFWSWYEEDASSVWLQVVDSETGRIAGGALWRVHETNPYEGGHDDEEDAYWQPEGGQREFANRVLREHEATRGLLARRGHLYLNIIFTHPDFQRTGVGSMMMDWGIEKARELGVELWLDAWPQGRELYTKYGFTTINHYALLPKTEKPDEAWKKFEAQWGYVEEWTMWRPKDGPYEEGKSIKPWEQ